MPVRYHKTCKNGDGYENKDHSWNHGGHFCGSCGLQLSGTASDSSGSDRYGWTGYQYDAEDICGIFTAGDYI